MSGADDVDAYIDGFPPETADRLRRVRAAITGEVPGGELRMRYGMPAVMLGGRYALHFAGWKKHIGLYPVPALDEAVEAEIAPYRSKTDSVVFPHSRPVPYDLIGRVTAAILALRADVR
nr:DUF1801 domain-containing protein [Microbacterium lemovicicum]